MPVQSLAMGGPAKRQSFRLAWASLGLSAAAVIHNTYWCVAPGGSRFFDHSRMHVQVQYVYHCCLSPIFDKTTMGQEQE